VTTVQPTVATTCQKYHNSGITAQLSWILWLSQLSCRTKWREINGWWRTIEDL